LSYLANTQTNRQTNRQTNKQTKTGKNITSLAEVIKKHLQQNIKPPETTVPSGLKRFFNYADKYTKLQSGTANLQALF